MLQDLFQRFAQRVEGESLLQEIRGTELFRGRFDLIRARLSQDDDRSLTIEGPDFAQHIETADVRELQVQGGKAGTVFAKPGQPNLPVGCGDDLVPAAAQHRVQEILNGRLIVDNKDPGHLTPSGSACDRKNRFAWRSMTMVPFERSWCRYFVRLRKRGIG